MKIGEENKSIGKNKSKKIRKLTSRRGEVFRVIKDEGRQYLESESPKEVQSPIMRKMDYDPHRVEKERGETGVVID